MRVTSEPNITDGMMEHIKKNSKNIGQFADKVYLPMMSIFLNSSINTYYTRQAVTEILVDQWKVGENWWKTGWSQNHGIDDWLKEKVIRTLLMIKVELSSILVLKPLRDVNIMGYTLNTADDDIGSIEQFNTMQDSKDPLTITRLDNFYHERMYLAQQEFLRSTWGNPQKMIDKISKNGGGKPNIKNNLFWFSNKQNISFPWAVSLALIDESISIESQLWAYVLNQNNPQMQKVLWKWARIDRNESDWWMQPVYS